LVDQGIEIDVKVVEDGDFLVGVGEVEADHGVATFEPA
jgi:hypothetical protein